MEAARAAVRGDADRCADMCREALDALQGARGGPLFARRETGLVAKALLRPGGLDRLMADPRRRVLVGTVDGAVVGLALGRVDAVGEAPIGIIDACYVEPPARGVGVGRALLDNLVAWFTASGCRGVDVTALPGDRSTKNFLEGAGFKARLLTMHRLLP
ncbi:MAG TPA: GNAT family N-acetyltransferase [Acidimicrobiales bacterium]|nr:GNAT family N-acetyltransferase [Acidimicrobiales bacterium]